MIEDIFKSRISIILISIILGLGLSCIFKIVCKERDCIILRAPDPKNIVGKTFKHESKCYQYLPYDTLCNKNAII